MKAQITLTSNGSKWLISEGILHLEEVKKALETGKIILKGGTTVSCISEKLFGLKLRISGRITNKGTVSSLDNTSAPHSILIHDKKWENIDDDFLDAVLGLSSDDVIITGANIIDKNGCTAIMAGSPGGGMAGRGFTAMSTEGSKVIIAAGYNKLIPGSINDIIRETGRKECNYSMGMAIGFMPIFGRLITEVEALELLYKVRAMVIGKGGIYSGEGSVTLLVEGERKNIEDVIEKIIEYNNMGISGDKKSLFECKPGSVNCKNHIRCIYKMKKFSFSK